MTTHLHTMNHAPGGGYDGDNSLACYPNTPEGLKFAVKQTREDISEHIAAILDDVCHPSDKTPSKMKTITYQDGIEVRSHEWEQKFTRPCTQSKSIYVDTGRGIPTLEAPFIGECHGEECICPTDEKCGHYAQFVTTATGPQEIPSPFPTFTGKANCNVDHPLCTDPNCKEDDSCVDPFVCKDPSHGYCPCDVACGRSIDAPDTNNPATGGWYIDLKVGGGGYWYFEISECSESDCHDEALGRGVDLEDLLKGEWENNEGPDHKLTNIGAPHRVELAIHCENCDADLMEEEPIIDWIKRQLAQGV